MGNDFLIVDCDTEYSGKYTSYIFSGPVTIFGVKYDLELLEELKDNNLLTKMLDDKLTYQELWKVFLLRKEYYERKKSEAITQASGS